jgi:uncharacterized membrane protein (UPF0127 family)
LSQDGPLANSGRRGKVHRRRAMTRNGAQPGLWRLVEWIAWSGLAALLALSLSNHQHWYVPAAPAMLVHVDDVPIEVEVADTPANREHGLKFRRQLAANAGMLFVYEHARPLAFWMKDTPIDLDIGFFDADSRLLNIATMTAYDDRTRHRSVAPARYALEANAGWFARHGLRPGARLRLLVSEPARRDR